MKKGNGNLLWLHGNIGDEGLRLRPLDLDDFSTELLSKCGAFEIIYKASETDLQ